MVRLLQIVFFCSIYIVHEVLVCVLFVSFNIIRYLGITKTRLFKYIENFISKNWKFSNKKKTLIVFIFQLKTYIVGTR